MVFQTSTLLAPAPRPGVVDSFVWRTFGLLFGGMLPSLLCGTLLWRGWTAPTGHDDFEVLRPVLLALGFLCSLPVLFLVLSGPVCVYALLRGVANPERAQFLVNWLTVSSFIAWYAAAFAIMALLSMVMQPEGVQAWRWFLGGLYFVSAALCGLVHFLVADRMRAILPKTEMLSLP